MKPEGKSDNSEHIDGITRSRDLSDAEEGLP
jgi:hypothetical protein